MRVVLTALSPISHGAFGDADIGNAVAIRREPIVSLTGFPRVPCLSGNALRGVTRRLIMRELFAAAGVSRESFAANPRAWDRLYAALANGGHLDGSEDKVEPTKIRELRAALPPLSVYGASLYTFMLHGHCTFGFAWPRCAETKAAGLVSEGEAAVEDLVSEISLCRHVDREEQDPTSSGVTPMPVTIEVISTGAVLESEITFSGGSGPIEQGAVAHAFDLLATVGGKAGAGLGRVNVVHDGTAGPYLEWLSANRAGLGSILGDLAERLSSVKPEKPRKGAKAVA